MKYVEKLEDRLARQVNAINKTLYQLHKAGQSVESRGNTYPLQLQEGELLQIEVRVNRCKHSFDWWKWRVDPDVTWERCRHCGMTRNIEEAVLSAEVIGD